MNRRSIGAALAILGAAATLVGTPRPASAAPGDITTVVGSNGDALGPQVAQMPTSLAFAGPLLYIADNDQKVVRVLDTRTGQERVVAGNGYRSIVTPGPHPSGDGGLAVNAQFTTLWSLGTDPAGNLYVVDPYGGTVRRVTPAGTISTVAGTPRDCCSLPPSGGDGGPATKATMTAPTSVAVDGNGNLFIADQGSHRIRKVDTSGTITTFAGDGSSFPSLVAEPHSLAFDRTGDLYFASGSAWVRRISPAGVISHVAGTGAAGFSGDGGLATKAQVWVRGVGTDAAGNVYLASGSDYVRRIDPAGTITSLARPANPPSADAIAIDAAGMVQVADYSAKQVFRLAAGSATLVAGNGHAGFSGDGGPALKAQFAGPAAVVVDTGGNTYISDSGNDRIRKITALGTVSTLTEISEPGGLVLDNLGRLLVATRDRILRIDPTSGGTTVVAGGGQRGGADADGHPGTEASLWLGGPPAMLGMVVDSAGNLFFPEPSRNRLRRLDPAGVLWTVVSSDDQDRCGSRSFPAPDFPVCASALAADAAGNLYLGEPVMGRIFRIGPGGTMARFQTDLPTRPSTLAIDGAGNILAADLLAATIHLINPSGTSRFIAGVREGFAGDGGPADQAKFFLPTALFVRGGDLLVADAGNNRIRKITGVVQPTSTRTVRVWGWNGLGQLGDGTLSERTAAGTVPGLGKVDAISAGYYHSLALKGGEVWAWGWNGTGQLGNGTRTDSKVPAKIPGLRNVSLVVAGAYHSMAVDGQGVLWAWGYNGTGQLGTGNTIDSLVPVKIPLASPVLSLSAGLLHTVAVLSDSKAWAWGWNGYGQLGDGTTTDRYRPVKVAGVPGIVLRVAAGGYHTLAGNIDGEVWAWGWNATGQLGDGTTTDRKVPVKVPVPVPAVRVTAGMYHSVAVGLGAPYGVYAWGWNGVGTVGDGTTTDRRSPVAVSELQGVLDVAAGYVHTVALRNDGTVWAWGFNALGQLGDGTKTDRPYPVEAVGLRGATGMSAGALHTVAL